jgi:C1A family cysteine protease
MPSNKWYGWRPSKPDFRDARFAVRPMSPALLPRRVDLTDKMPEVYDQGELGSCTANALCGAMEYLMMRTGREAFTPSRLFVYYEERVMEDSVKEDAGAEIKDGIKVLAKIGAPPEKLWQYDIDKFARKPPQAAYDAALKDLLGAYRKVYNTNLNAIKTPLARGNPVVFGFTVYDGFESAKVEKTGELDLPGPAENQLGGHAVMAVGYDDETQRLIVRNSWSKKWGLQGYFTMPYDYAVNPDLSSDYWALESI